MKDRTYHAMAIELRKLCEVPETKENALKVAAMLGINLENKHKIRTSKIKQTPSRRHK